MGSLQRAVDVSLILGDFRCPCAIGCRPGGAEPHDHHGHGRGRRDRAAHLPGGVEQRTNPLQGRPACGGCVRWALISRLAVIGTAYSASLRLEMWALRR
jgi:hypothetical protein